jgi:hypothetical protein
MPKPHPLQAVLRAIMLEWMLRVLSLLFNVALARLRKRLLWQNSKVLSEQLVSGRLFSHKHHILNVFIVVYNNVEGDLNGTLGESNDAAFVPAAGISLADGQALVQKLSSGPVTATLDLEFFRETRWSQNVIASSKAGNQSNVVFIGVSCLGYPEVSLCLLPQ